MSEFTLNALGWSDWFARQAKVLCRAGRVAARVTAVDRDQLLVVGESGFFPAKLSGKFMFDSATASDRPCVGDWICIDKSDSDTFAVVHDVFERRTYLRRKAIGDSVDYQMIATNVDFVVVVQSCHYDFNVNRLERYLIMIKDGGATPLILLTKTDLVSAEVLADQIEQIRKAGITELVTALSNVTKEGVDELKQLLSPSKTYCFVGSSGVGKSTIVNSLVGQDLQETGAVSDSGEGQHTTVRRELVFLESGAMVIDNPGMREFGVFGAEDGLEENYADILELASQCRFGDCKHSNEPGCAVLEALEQDDIDASHFDNFIKLLRESAHSSLSYVEKRKKDRKFGRFIKSAKKKRGDD